MFLKRKNRLTTKDIRYMLRKRNIIFSQYFSCLRVPQYVDKKYHQYSVNIGLAYSKSAVKRRKLKKMLLAHLRTLAKVQQPLWWKYYKLFFSLNKKNIPDLQSRFAWMSRLQQKKYVSTLAMKMRKNISHKLK